MRPTSLQTATYFALLALLSAAGPLHAASEPPEQSSPVESHPRAPEQPPSATKETASPEEPPTPANARSPEIHSAPPAKSSRDHRLVWPGRRFYVWDFVATGVVFTGSVLVDKATQARKDPRWTGPILFDGAAERGLLGDTRRGRQNAQDASAYLTLTPQVAAVIDGAAVPLLFDRFNWQVAWRMSLLNVQAMSLNGLLSRTGHRLVARERPDADFCREDPEFSERCGHGYTSSFPSGHTSTAFVGAGLVCAHHLAMPLYGHPVFDGAACAVNVGIATSSGVLRIVTGRHYATDVVAGALVGAAAGFLIPTLVYYRKPKHRRQELSSWTLVPSVTSQSVALGAAGLF